MLDEKDFYTRALKEKARVLALDYGEKRIGLAISDADLKIAFPLKVVENTGYGNLEKELKILSNETKIGAIVLGHPKTPSGDVGPLEKHLQSVASKLKESFGWPIFWVDERYTSRGMTHHLITGADVSRAKRKKVLDKLAAARILETFLMRIGQ